MSLKASAERQVMRESTDAVLKDANGEGVRLCANSVLQLLLTAGLTATRL